MTAKAEEKRDTHRVNFTKRFVESLELPKDGRATIYDAETPGLGIKLERAKVFFWFRTARGKPTWITIGPWPEVSIDDARGRAGDLNTARARWKAEGWNPEYWKNRKEPNPFERDPQPEPGELTLDQLLERYVEEHLREHAKDPAKAEKDIRWRVSKYLADFKLKSLRAILPCDVEELHREIGRRHKRTANLVVKTLRILFRFAVKRHLWEGHIPTLGVTFYREEKRMRFIQPVDELPRLYAALARATNPDLRDYVLLSLATGARKSDVLGMRWEDVHFDADPYWHVPNPKARVPYVIPLAPDVVKLLKARPHVADSPYVFPSHGATGHVTDLKKAWKAMLEDAGLYHKDPEKRITQHDCRRTLGSYLAAKGVPLLTISRALGHQSVQATQIYARLDVRGLRKEMDSVNAVMRVAMRKKPKQARAAKMLLPAPKSAKAALRG